MASPQFFQPPGPIGDVCREHGFSNAVVLPPNAQIVITAGQAGLDTQTGKLVETSPADQISAAFDCCDLALKSAGVVNGLGSAHKILSFFLDTRYETLMMEIWRKRYPDHRPTWTCVGASNLCIQGMICEIQAEAVLLS
jgi:enamine deaminase RidA (YjgF/YER057c/UK114 family)